MKRMHRIISIVLILTLLIYGCSESEETAQPSSSDVFAGIVASQETATGTSAEPATEAAVIITEPATQATTERTLPPEDSSFEIHFIDVGQADAALVLCDSKALLIDGGEVKDSSLLYTYLKNRVSSIWTM